MAKKSIIINQLDNVAVALADLEKGGIYEGVTLAEDITKGHKFALRPIKEGEDIIKYGTPIAHATRDIAVGEHVHTHNVATNLNENLEYVYRPVDCTLPAGKMRKINVYRRKNGDRRKYRPHQIITPFKNRHAQTPFRNNIDVLHTAALWTDTASYRYRGKA